MNLTDELKIHFRLSEEQKRALDRLGIKTVFDILYYFPIRYTNISEIKTIAEVSAGDTVTFYGKISKLKTKKSFRTKIPMGEAELEDNTGKIRVVWFHQAYMAKMVHEGDTVELSGKISSGKAGIFLSNPELKAKNILPIDSHNSLFGDNAQSAEIFGFPIYRETSGITSRFIYHTIQKIIGAGVIKNIKDPIPEQILEEYNLPKINTALVWMHSPQNQNDATVARKRFSFEEVFCIQLARKIDRENYEKNKSYPIKIDDGEINDFIKRFPFTYTDAQSNAIKNALIDMAKIHPMARLLEGDVGSGKTAVAATLSYAVIKNRPDGKNFGNLQVAYMAPTEILATQLFENFIQYFKHTGISIGLITGSGCRKFPTKVASAQTLWTTISRSQLLKWVANGEIPILIGTHALIQKSVIFKHLALVIIDEQHRFGTMQRKKLVTKEGFAPHLLSMTATPIPRTLALTIYGDLDLTLLDQMPSGRKPIITEIILPEKRDEVYENIRKLLHEGRQAYIICPRIDEPDEDKELALQMRSVTSEAKRLKKDIFPKNEIGILHSKMTKEKKEKIMQDFAEHKIDILVATSVVEVGVNIPNATVILIEGAERFGLSQLHQLRGRVIRGTHQAYCYLVPNSTGENSLKRLQALKKAKNGFELSELDLALRGAGELGGIKQWGITDIGMEAIKNIKMVEAARNEAQKIIKKDPDLSSYPNLKALVEQKRIETHFE